LHHPEAVNHAYNEVAFAPRVTHPDKKARIMAFFIDSDKTEFQNKGGQQLPPTFYYNKGREWAKKFNVPLVDLAELRNACKGKQHQ
jgi:hypothetical protein